MSGKKQDIKAKTLNFRPSTHQPVPGGFVDLIFIKSIACPANGFLDTNHLLSPSRSSKFSRLDLMVTLSSRLASLLLRWKAGETVLATLILSRHW